VSVRVIRAGVWNPWCADRPAGGTRLHSPNIARETRVGMVMTTGRDATSFLRGGS
jgi:hypothetical protein